MAKQLIVAVFSTLDAARKAADDFDALSEKDEYFHIENGVVVEKSAAGKLIVLDAEARPRWSGVVGAIVGGLLGALGGPAVAVAGAAGGASVGLVADTATDSLLDQAFVQSVALQLATGCFSIVLEAKESTPFSVDNIVKGFDGTVVRKALS